MSDCEPFEDWDSAWESWAESKKVAQRVAPPKDAGQIDVTVTIDLRISSPDEGGELEEAPP